MADPDPSPDVARVQPPMEVSNRNRMRGTCCRRRDSIGRMNLAGRGKSGGRGVDDDVAHPGGPMHLTPTGCNPSHSSG
jgi:hypothetical protein